MESTVVHGRTWPWDRVYVMGVVNVTPDSFSDGGRYYERSRAVAHGLALERGGADILDVGGESTRPGAEPVSADEEIARVVPVIEALAGAVNCAISVDTYKAEVARAACEAGATWINDVSGLSLDPGLAQVAADMDAGLVLGHIRGTPQIMQSMTDYDDCVEDVSEALIGSVQLAVASGVHLDRIVVDPAIGFGKTADQNLMLMAGSARIRRNTGRPVLVGPSRKSFIGHYTGAPVEERLPGTIAASVVSALSGADVLRVHDVAEIRQALVIVEQFRRLSGPLVPRGPSLDGRLGF
ncbi:MAG: dihydropteroate synthase [Deltaproteobacteria bacterium]|nr:dihydropteroate synthase [Deltaproteobacteria bacterium]